MNTSPAALTATFWGWSSELSAAGKPTGPAKPRPAMPVPAMRRVTPAGVTSGTALSPLSAMNTSPLASTAVPPGWYSDALVAWPPSPCSPNAVSDPANAVVPPLAMAAMRLAPVSDTYTVPLAAETPTGWYRLPPGPVAAQVRGCNSGAVAALG